MSKTIVGLFGDQATAEDAVTDLSDAPYNTEKMRVYDASVADNKAKPGPGVTHTVATPKTGGPTAVAPSINPADDPVVALGMDEATGRFFKRGLRKGGVMIVVEAEDDEADGIKKIMADHDAQFSVS